MAPEAAREGSGGQTAACRWSPSWRWPGLLRPAEPRASGLRRLGAGGPPRPLRRSLPGFMAPLRREPICRACNESGCPRERPSFASTLSSIIARSPRCPDRHRRRLEAACPVVARGAGRAARAAAADGRRPRGRRAGRGAPSPGRSPSGSRARPGQGAAVGHHHLRHHRTDHRVLFTAVSSSAAADPGRAQGEEQGPTSCAPRRRSTRRGASTSVSASSVSAAFAPRARVEELQDGRRRRRRR